MSGIFPHVLKLFASIEHEMFLAQSEGKLKFALNLAKCNMLFHTIPCITIVLCHFQFLVNGNLKTKLCFYWKTNNSHIMYIRKSLNLIHALFEHELIIPIRCSGKLFEKRTGKPNSGQWVQLLTTLS